MKPTAPAAPIRRVDPRRPARAGPAGLLRRGAAGGGAGAAVSAGLPATPAAKPLRSAGPFTRITLVATHAERGALSDAARQAIAAAAILADADTEVVLAVLGACNDDVAALGADRLLTLALDSSRYQPTACVQWLQGLRAALAPAHWLFADHGADGQLGRRFAVAAGLGLACGVVEIGATSLRVAASADEDWLCPHAPVMLLPKGLVNARLPFVGQGRRQDAPPLPDLIDLPEPGVEDLGLQAADPQTLALEDADFIVGAGNGVADLALLHALALEVGAAVGASRVAVDAGRFARAQQIGATGKSVSASAYLALGISGAVQHLQGIKDCRHVIAVNLDAAAPIARRANLTVVEDSAALMRSLLALVRKAKAEPGSAA